MFMTVKKYNQLFEIADIDDFDDEKEETNELKKIVKKEFPELWTKYKKIRLCFKIAKNKKKRI